MAQRRDRAGSVYLSHEDLRHGPSCVGVPPPSLREVAAWISRSAPPAPDRSATTDTVHRAKVLASALVRVDHARVDARESHHRSQRRSAATLAQQCQRLIAEELRLGLERCVGDHLTGGDERVYLHLRVRAGLNPPGLCVCEECGIVFRAARAEACETCRKSRRSLELRPWHLDVLGAERFDPKSRELLYWGRCTCCGATFAATDPRTRYCRNCGGAPGRVRRNRQSASRTGRQRYRFAARDGQPLAAVSFAFGPDGRTIMLEGRDGIVETDDAEVAHYVGRAFSNLFLIEG